jgi:ANTAR domain-containing protein
VRQVLIGPYEDIALAARTDDQMRNPRVTTILTSITDGQGRGATLPVRLCAQCLSAVPVSGVALALTTADGPGGVVLAATDRRARQLEELQLASGEGPGFEAAATGRPVLQSELAATGPTRWPKFCKAVLPLGVRSLFAFPLGVGATRLGFLDLYRDIPGRLTRPELVDALTFADAATVVLLHLRGRSLPDGAPATSTRPIDGRAEVHQATGMIMVQLGVSLTEAQRRLRAHAYATGRMLTDVASDVVDHRLRFDARQPQ